MNIKYRQLKAFELAVEAGSFRAAADRLAVTQSSFSALIRELERDVGVALFERTTRTCRPTEAGRQLHDRIRGPLADLEDGYGYVRDIGRGERGVLSIAVLPSLAPGLVGRHVARFRATHPDVRVRLRERKHAELIDAVAAGDVEFGIGVMLRAVPDLSFRYLVSDELMFVVPDGHPLASAPAAWKALERYPYIYVGNGNAQHALAVAQVRTPAAIEVEHVGTAIAMVRLGLGVSVVASSSVDGHDLSGLVCVPVRGDAAVRRVGVIQRRSRPLGAAARAFVEQLTGDARTPAKAARRAPARDRRGARAATGAG